MPYNFNPELTKRIKKYAGAKWRHGSFIRWLLEDENGTSVYCDQCGNIANVVKIESQGRYRLHVPVCNSHAEELLASDETWQLSLTYLVVYQKENGGVKINELFTYVR